MSSTSHRRRLVTSCIALTFLIALACSAAASAAPGTVTGPEGLSMTVSDTTPVPGEVVSVGISYTIRSADVGAENVSGGFGADPINGTPFQNLADLTFVPGSCSGDYVICSPDPGDGVSFKYALPDATAVGDVVAGSADFTVSSSATVGETISFFGYRQEALPGASAYTVYTTGSTPLALTVTAPGADLGVSLSASAAGLLTSHVNYDAAVHNNGPAGASSATITTQLASQATSITSSTCTFSSSTHQVSCPIGALANGATTHATFSAYFGLLTIGLPLNATATRTAGSPSDTNAANDSDSASCLALTTLLIGC
jgi:Domain of unknown function DUF11